MKEKKHVVKTVSVYQSMRNDSWGSMAGWKGVMEVVIRDKTRELVRNPTTRGLRANL